MPWPRAPGCLAEAIAAYDRATEIEPNHAEGHAGQAAAPTALGRSAGAKEAGRGAVGSALLAGRAQKPGQPTHSALARAAGLDPGGVPDKQKISRAPPDVAARADFTPFGRANHI